MTLAKKLFFLVLNSNQSNVALLSLLISLPKKLIFGFRLLLWLLYAGTVSGSDAAKQSLSVSVCIQVF